MGTIMDVRFGRDWRDRADMGSPIGGSPTTLQWRHNGLDGVSLTSLTIVYSTVYSAANQRKHQSSASLAFVRWIHRGPVNSPHKWPVKRGKCFHLMTSSWNLSPIRSVYLEMRGSCSTNDGTVVGQQRWEFSGAWPKVNQASRVPHQSWPQFD